MSIKLDVLVFASHPDDAELGVAGTICKLTAAGKQVGIVDLTRGELGSRGSAALRDQEAAEAGRRMGLRVRENLAFRDGFFVQDEAHQLAIVRKVRQYRPDLVIANAPQDRHPDHGRGSKLVRDAVFLSGLRRIETTGADGLAQEAWRPARTFFYIQDYHLTPSFVVDVTPYWAQKQEVIRAFGSQFFIPGQPGEEPQTYISNEDFWHFLEARARVLGHMIGATFGEGFISEQPLAVGSPLDLL
ncbi:MAG: bacillithiol biosynthesis deacetylase BshB1 [Bacteroidia bacterium]